MLGRRYISTSYLQQQLASNIKRVKQIAELQSKMALQDLTNHELMDQMVHLQSENQLLKKRLYQRELDQKRLIQTQSKAIDRASQYLYHKKYYKPRNPTQVCVNSHCKNNQFWKNSATLCQNRHRASKSTFQGKVQSHIYEQPTKDETILSKNVYIDPQQNKQKFSSPLSKKKPKLQTVTFKRQRQTNKSQKLDLRDKFPSRVNEFQIHSAHKRFEQCDLSDSKIQKSNVFNRWNSQAEMNMHSEMISKMDQSAHKKRKTFLSVVSHSSVFKNN